MQAVIRGFLTKKQYQMLKDQRVALQVIQRTLRTYMKNKKWPWFNLMQRVIPLCAGNKEARELKKLEEKTAKLEETLKKLEEGRKAQEEKNSN
jgi:myosin protein heavy chain